jgi:hypothetical protein
LVVGDGSREAFPDRVVGSFRLGRPILLPVDEGASLCAGEGSLRSFDVFVGGDATSLVLSFACDDESPKLPSLLSAAPLLNMLSEWEGESE